MGTVIDDVDGSTIDVHRFCSPAVTPLTAVPRALDDAAAATYAGWFAVLSDPTRVRLLHAVSTAPTGPSGRRPRRRLGISQSTCSHHVRKLADVGFVDGRQGRHRQRGLGEPRLLHRPPPRRRRRHGHARGAPVLPRGPARPTSPPGRMRRRRPRRRPPHLRRGHRHPQRHLRDRGAPAEQLLDDVAARPPVGRRARRPGRRLDRRLPGVEPRRATPASARPASTSPRAARGRGVGKALLWRQVNEADRAACGRCRPRSSPRTAPRSRCTTRPATAPSRCARGSPGSTASGATPCCSSAAARPTSRDRDAGRQHRLMVASSRASSP